jgi:hypothetical protein
MARAVRFNAFTPVFSMRKNGGSVAIKRPGDMAKRKEGTDQFTPKVDQPRADSGSALAGSFLLSALLMNNPG